MYRPRHFRNEDQSQVLDFARARAFGAFVIVHPRHGLYGAHVPFLIDQGPQSQAPRLRFHVAAANPIHKAIDGANPGLMIVGGPDAYVSPDWYETEHMVPTWNYIAVHLSGTPALMPAEKLPALLDDLSDRLEQELLPKPVWTTAKLPEASYANLRRAIVGITMEVTAIEGQWKLSQNRSAADRGGVIRALRERGRANDLAIADAVETASGEFS